TEDQNDAFMTIKSVWDTIIQSIPQWQQVMDGTTTPGDLRKDYVFAHGVAWQAIARAAAVIIQAQSQNWRTEVRRVLGSVDWAKSNPEWQGIAMIGDRINNTSPGVKATAGYILRKAGITGEHAEPYLTAYTRSL